MQLQRRCDGRTECIGLPTLFSLRDSPAQASSEGHFLRNAIINLTSEIDYHRHV